MALLTEEQINQLVKMASVPIYLYDKICEWNAQQTTQQFEVDWSKAPRDVKGAILKSYWVGGDMCTLGQTVAEYKRPAPAITPHPHAAIMAKYAEVAARRVDPWVEFEIKDFDTGSWTALNIPLTFFAECEYRHIGDSK